MVKEVILGYEPADDDMMILRVARKQIEMLNENVLILGGHVVFIILQNI